MEADYPTHALVVGRERARSRPWFTCAACLFETETTLDDGSCPACGGALRLAPRQPAPPGADDAADDGAPHDAADGGAPQPPEAQALATLLELLSGAFGAAGVAHDFAPAGGRVPQRVIDSLPRVKLSPFVELRAYVVRERAEPAAAVARLLADKAQPELVLQGTNSSFGPALSFLPHGLAALAEAATPADGAALANGAQLADRMALMARGGISFAAKVAAAQEARAAGVVVVQQAGGVWPFTMSDSKGEAGGVQIPSVMVHAQAGADLRALLERARGAGGHVLIHATARHASSSCAICLELFQVGTEAAQLPCGHCFHEACVAKWLAKSSVCPSCRGPVVAPASGDAEEGAPVGSADAQGDVAGSAMFG